MSETQQFLYFCLASTEACQKVNRYKKVYRQWQYLLGRKQSDRAEYVDWN